LVVIGSLIEGSVAPFWSEAQSQMSEHVTPQRSERVCPRGRPRGHPVIKYSIIDRESIDTILVLRKWCPKGMRCIK
jgi:hypothetical protein